MLKEPWLRKTPASSIQTKKIVYNRATEKVSGGDFVLMHPKEHTLKALPDILKKYFESGLIVTTVTQCMENDG